VPWVVGSWLLGRTKPTSGTPR